MSPNTHRTILPPITASGRRHGYYRLVTSIAPADTNPSALQGTPLPPDKQIDLPLGAIIISATPVGSARHHSFEWRYSTVPPQDLPFPWSPPTPQRRFLDFLDAVAAELDRIPQVQHPPIPHPFPIAASQEPRAPQDIHSAQQLYDALAEATADPGLKTLDYSWSNGGFTAHGTPTKATNSLLVDASIFLQWALHTAPAFTLPLTSLHRQTLTVTLTNTAVFEAAHQVPIANIETLAASPTFAPAAHLLLQQIHQALPDLMAAAWNAIESAAQPHGFRLGDTPDPAAKLLLPQHERAEG